MLSIDNDSNLLFAVLALQADCLTQARFVEACTLWSSHKDTPIADLLVERGWLTPDEAFVEPAEKPMVDEPGCLNAGIPSLAAPGCVMFTGLG